MSKKTIGIIKEQSNELTISSEIVLNAIGENKQILSACLILNNIEAITSKNIFGKFSNGVGKRIETIGYGKYEKFSINITQELNKIIKNETDKFIIDASNIYIYGKIELIINYMAKRTTMQNNAKLDFEVENVGSGKINLATGEFCFSTLWLSYNSWQKRSREIIISNSENKNLTFNTSCGNGWKLNVSRFLVQMDGSEDKSVYTYIDGEGIYHEFYEKYYYLQDNKKIYVNKNLVQVDLNGKLTHVETNKELFIERKSTSGLILQTDYTSFNNGEYIETRLNEQIQLEEQLSAYDLQLKEYIAVKEDGSPAENGKLNSYFENSQLSEKSFSDFMKVAETNKLFTNSEFIQYKSINKDNEDVLNNYNNLSDKNKIFIRKYFKQYLNVKNQLNNLYLQIPVSFITDGDNIMCFNKDGYFVAEIDAYNNQTAIIYEGDKIIAIKDSDNNETHFEYNDNGLLFKIIDSNNKTTKMEYDSRHNLVKIIYSDNEYSEFSYIYGSGLNSANNQYGYGIIFEYGIFGRVEVVKYRTRFITVSDNNIIKNNSFIDKTFAEISYKGNMTTSVKNQDGGITTYIFDQLGNPTTIFEGEYAELEEKTYAITMEYCDGNKSYAVTEDLDKRSLLIPDINSSNPVIIETKQINNGKINQKIYTLSNLPEGLTDYVFSCWVLADSGYIPDAKEKDNDIILNDNQKNRKFELKAKVHYDDGFTDEFQASFDWMNTDWQFLSLPIELKEGNKLPAEIPVKLGGKVVSVDLIIDYSYNFGHISINKESFRPGKWQYSTFDEGGRKLTDEDSESNSITSYEYDENDRVIKQVLTDRERNTFVTIFEYNKQGKLVRSIDYSGMVNETVYDEKGGLLRTIVYNKDDPTSKFYSESRRDEKGNIIADIDESGLYDSTTYLYEDNTSVVVKDGKSNKTSLGYKDGEIISISGNTNGEEITNSKHYTAGLLTKVSNGDTDYNFEYDEWGRITELQIGGKKYAGYSYSTEEVIKTGFLQSGEKFDIKENQTIKTISLNNGFAQTFKYNNQGKIVEQTNAVGESIQDKITYRYNASNKLYYKTIDKSDGIKYYITYGWNNGKCTGEQGKDVVKNYQFDSEGVLEDISYSVCAIGFNYHLTTDNTPQKHIISIKFGNQVQQDIAYDGLGRTKEITLGENLVKDIYYQKFGDHATNRVSTVWYGVNGVRKDSLKYTYDKAGNIQTITENGVVIARYVYDGLNRLISENNSQLNQKIKYEYDHAGNIVCKSVNGKKYKYSYPISGWRDQLLSFDNEADKVYESCEYDAIGNPTKYRNRNLVWQGRRLQSIGSGTSLATYTYDVDSVRTSKTVTDGSENFTCKYVYDGNTLLGERRNNKWIYYIYGVDGVAGFKYDGKVYLYRKNIQGDITHIYEKCQDGSLNQVAHYAYDAFGNFKILQGEDENSIANINPFRYRGYYYDSETGLYYLISRYYDPETGRFISADSIEYLDPETLGGLNLYAYCGNNPVMYVDPTGEAFLLFLVAALIGGIVSFAASAATQAIFNDGHVNWGVAAIDGLFGAIAGALWMVPGLGPVATGFINAGLTAVNGIITTGIENDWKFTLGDAISIGLSSALSGVASWFARYQFFKAGGQNLLKNSHKFIGTISQRIMSGHYNNSAAIFSKSFRSAAGQMFKNIFKLNFGDNFYKDWLITGLQAIFSISLSKGLSQIKW